MESTFSIMPYSHACARENTKVVQLGQGCKRACMDRTGFWIEPQALVFLRSPSKHYLLMACSYHHQGFCVRNCTFLKCLGVRYLCWCGGFAPSSVS